MFPESGSRGAKEQSRIEDRADGVKRERKRGSEEKDRARKFNVDVSQYGQVITRHRST